MSNMSAFWQGWVIVLTVANIIFCFWLIWWTMKRRAGEAATGDVTGHVWDGDLQEYNNPLPRWWLWMFYGTLIFGIAYYVLYPGLWDGVLGWSQEGQYDAEMQKAEEKYGPIFAQYASVACTGAGQERRSHRHGQAPVPDLLHAVPRLRRPRLQGLSQPGRRRLAVGRLRPSRSRRRIANGRNGVMPRPRGDPR